MKKIKVFVDGMPLTGDRPSGIGHLVRSTLTALNNLEEFQESYELVQFVPKRSIKQLKKNGIAGVKTRSLVYPASRVVNSLNYLHVLPPIDYTLGKGIYLYMNYNNYPVSKKSRSVTWVHDICFERFPETVSPKLRTHLHKHMPFWLKRTDKAVGISAFSSREIVEYYKLPASKVGLVMGGIDTDLFYRRTDDEIVKTLERYKLPKNYALFIGNIEPRKNLVRLMKAFASLSSKLKNEYALVVVGGDGWNNDPIYGAIDQARKDGATIILPDKYVPDEDLPALMSGAKFLVHPAVYEGFGLTPLEALACGTDVLVSDIAPLHEVVGSFGDYVVAHSVPALSAALELKMSAPTRINKTTQSKVEGYSWENAAVQLLRLLDELSATIKSQK